MRVTDFVALLADKFPALQERLTIDDLSRFASVAAEVYARFAKGLKLKPTDKAVIPFFQLALGLDLSFEETQALWIATFPHLSICQANPTQLIKECGHHPDLELHLPERFLSPPITECLLCPKDVDRTLTEKGILDAYLYDIDGVHTVQYLKTSCPRTCPTVYHCRLSWYKISSDSGFQGCGTVYRPSYFTHEGIRHYYTIDQNRQTDIFHVHCHYFMTTALAAHFRFQQMQAQ